MPTFALVAVLALALSDLVAPSARAAEVSDSTLTFLREGAVVKTFDRAALTRACKVVTVTLVDPYYGRQKHYRACALAEVLGLGFGPLGAGTPAGTEVIFRARDGYEKPASLDHVREAGGYLALADADRMHGDDPGWEPIDRRQVDPAPYYVVWENPSTHDPNHYPWPYQLVAIELTSYASRYPHTAPAGLPDDAPAWAGFTIFRRECIACHAINGEGGTIGPELNLPQSIIEYRPEEQLKAFIRKPETFRYTSMPSHEHLTATDLDAVVAYFRAMRDRKHDPKTMASPAAP